MLSRAIRYLGRINYDRVKRVWWDQRAKDIHAKWGSNRHDYEVLGSIIDAYGVQSVLDIGCGSGRLFRLWKQKGVDALGIDISKEALRIAGECYPEIPTQCVPLEELECTQTFDLIVSNRVLQHISPSQIETVLAKLAKIGHRLYLNESTGRDSSHESWYLFILTMAHFTVVRLMLLSDVSVGSCVRACG